MLRGSLAFLVLVAFAVLGAELRNFYARRGVRRPTMEGISFLLVGMVLGSRGLGLFPEDLVSALRVVVLFGLAWIGLVFGVQIELRIIRRLPPWQRWVGFLTPLFLGVPVSSCALLMGMPTELALGLGAISMAGSPASLESLARGRRTIDRVGLRLLKLVTAFAGIPAVALFAVAAAVASPLTAERGGPLSTGNLIVVMVAVGVLVGYGLVVLIRGAREHIQLLTLAAGSMCLVAGASSVLGFSALPAAACAGAVLVNRSIFPHRILRVAHAWERPMLVALLVLVGASWDGAAFALPVFVLLTVVRALGALAGGEVLGRVAGRFGGWPRPRLLGLGLLPQGELALGLLVAIITFFPDSTGVLEAVVAALVVNNIVSGRWMRRRIFAADGEGTRE